MNKPFSLPRNLGALLVAVAIGGVYAGDGVACVSANVDARSKNASYSYDDLGRVKTILFGDDTHTLTYDTVRVGKLSGFSDGSGSTSYGYDGLGFVNQVNSTIGTFNRTVGYSNNHVGQWTGMNIRGQTTVFLISEDSF